MNWKSLTILVSGLASGPPAYADTFSGTNIAIPGGLSQGDRFQLVFVTSGLTTATSTDIADYNSFVNSDANMAGSWLTGLGINWSVLGSTDAVNVLSNIVNTPSSIPLYDLTGNLVAQGTGTSAGGLYSGGLLNPIDTSESGVSIFNYVWTGTAATGATLNPLGGSLIMPGYSSAVDTSWTQVNPNSGFSWDLYAISQLLEEGPGETLVIATPEPAAMGMTLADLAVCFLVSRRGRRSLVAGQSK